MVIGLAVVALVAMVAVVGSAAGVDPTVVVVLPVGCGDATIQLVSVCREFGR